MRLRPAISYFGSKWRLARKYPRPRHARLVEPFAGGANYALLYHDLDVVLCDTYEPIVQAWDYLIRATPSEILALPDVVDTLDATPMPEEAKRLAAWWLNKATTTPQNKMSAWGRQPEHAYQFWGPEIRARLAHIAAHIKHWQIHHCAYWQVGNDEATWFVDPPYQDQGRRYAHSFADFDTLAQWCASRQGQVIVCEQEGADWLPFEPFAPCKGTSRNSVEVIWTNDNMQPCMI